VRARDALAVLIVALSLGAIPLLLRRLEQALPFEPAPREKRRPGVLLLGLALTVVLTLVAWPTVSKDAFESYRFIAAAWSHDEGLYKHLLLRMVEERTLDPYPEQACFNYGHLHILLSVLPVLVLRLSGSVAFLLSKVLSFAALPALAVAGGAALARRRSLVAGLVFGLLVLTDPELLARSRLPQTPDVLLILELALTLTAAWDFAEKPSARSIGLATLGAGVAFGTKYVGLFLVPLLVLVLLVKLEGRPWRRPILLLAGIFLAGAFACSPYHVLDPKPVALIFIKARSEYGPGGLDPLAGLRPLFHRSLLDLALLPLALVQGLRVLARRRLDGNTVLAAWAALWTGYVALGMGNNVGSHLILPASVVYLAATTALAGKNAWSFLPGILVVVAALLPSPLENGASRLAHVGGFLDAGRAPTELPREKRELDSWLETNKVPHVARVFCDDAEPLQFVPEDYPTFVEHLGPPFKRDLGLMLGYPEVLLVRPGYRDFWLAGVPGFPRLTEIQELYRDLEADRAFPYEHAAKLACGDVYTLPWLHDHELLDSGAKLSGDLAPWPTRENAYPNVRPYRAYQGKKGTAEWELAEPARAEWFVLLWGSRENMPGWYKDEGYGTAFRLEAQVGEEWRTLVDASNHTPDAFGGHVARLDAPLAKRYRFTVLDWKGEGPVWVERLSLLGP
jgi:hypothetical protein